MPLRAIIAIALFFCFITLLPSCKKEITDEIHNKPTQAITQTATVAPTKLPSATPSPTKAVPTKKPTATPVITPAARTSSAALSNVSHGWGFVKKKGTAPDIGAAYTSVLNKYGGVYIGDTSTKNIYLTFDEGYENGYTPKILDTLKQNNVPACFFITMPYLKEQLPLIKRMIAEGHEVGNHTVNHPSMPEVVSDAKLEEELLGLDRVYYEKTGRSMSFLRPPKGEFSERTMKLSYNLGYTTVFWSFAYLDWDVNKQKGSQYAYNEVMDYLHGGAVLLLHAVSKDNAAALDSIIKSAKDKGYVFRPISDLKR